MPKITITVTIPSGETCTGCRYQTMGNDDCLLFGDRRIRHNGDYLKCAACEEADPC